MPISPSGSPTARSRVEIEATYPIEEIKAALAHAGREGRAGKILVLPNGPID